MTIRDLTNPKRHAERMFEERCSDFTHGKPSEADVARIAFEVKTAVEEEHDCSLILTCDAYGDWSFTLSRR
jgi:hypothetical protein